MKPTDVRQIYLEAQGPSDLYDYDPRVATLGTVVLNTQAGDYQGDYLYLLRRTDNRWGYLIVGYGSCSGCDALQGAHTWKDVQELYDTIARDIRWLPKGELLPALREDIRMIAWYGDEASDFYKRVREVLAV